MIRMRPPHPGQACKGEASGSAGSGATGGIVLSIWAVIRVRSRTRSGGARTLGQQAVIAERVSAERPFQAVSEHTVLARKPSHSGNSVASGRFVLYHSTASL